MIDWISNWASAIIVAVIIGTIIEMILPEGNSKKYIKVVIGIYVLFTIISPVITKFTGKYIEVSDIIDLDEYVEEVKETSKMQNTIQCDNEKNIKDIYIEGIQNDIKTKVEAKGYSVNNVKVEIANDDSYNILSIDMNVRKIDSNIKEEGNDLSNKIEAVEGVNKIEINIGENNDIDDIKKEEGEKRRKYFE